MSDLFLERDAVISDCGKYRYLLRRTWDRAEWMRKTGRDEAMAAEMFPASK